MVYGEVCQPDNHAFAEVFAAVMFADKLCWQAEDFVYSAGQRIFQRLHVRTCMIGLPFVGNHAGYGAVLDDDMGG